MSSDNTAGGAQPGDLHPLDAMRQGAPCPTWCEHDGAPDRHLYVFPDPLREDEENDHVSGYRRTHRRRVASTLPGGEWKPLTLSIEQGEATDSPDQPSSLDAAVIWFHAPDQGAELTATSARQLAAALMDAADLLDAVVSEEGQ